MPVIQEAVTVCHINLSVCIDDPLHPVLVILNNQAPKMENIIHTSKSHKQYEACPMTFPTHWN
jgi:hypothetical protein